MTTPQPRTQASAPPPHLPAHLPAAAQRLHAAAAIRGIGHLRITAAKHFTCGPCQVTWAGAETDCWNCGRPATTEYGLRSSALQLLLHTVHAASARRAKPVLR